MCKTVLPFVSRLLGHAPRANRYRTISSKPSPAANDSGYSPQYVLLKEAENHRRFLLILMTVEVGSKCTTPRLNKY